MSAAVAGQSTTSTQRQHPDRLSSQDRAIFAELQRDGRTPFTTVADRLGVSEAHVRRRVKTLTDDDMFAITAVADPRVLGLDCMAWIGLNVRPALIEAVADALLKVDAVDYLVVSSGRFNVIAEVSCPTSAELEPILTSLRALDGVERLESYIYLSLAHQQFQWFLLETPHGVPVNGAGVKQRPREFDPLDIGIIRELEQDGRASFRTIGQHLGVSERLVSTRYATLVDQNVLKVIAVGNPINLGYDAMAWIGLVLDRDADRATVARGLGRIPAIDYVLVPSGPFDLIGELVCRDGDDLLETLTKDVGAVEGIAQVETFPFLKLLYKSTAGAYGVGRSTVPANSA